MDRQGKVSSIPLAFDFRSIVLVIKIYDIYTHTGTRPNRIWDAMGQQLTAKGKEYSRRSDLCLSRHELWLTFLLFATAAFFETVPYVPVVTSIFRRVSDRKVSKMTPNLLYLFSPMKTWGRCVCIVSSSDRDSHMPVVTFPPRVRNFILFFPTSQSKALYSLEKYVTFSQVCLLPTPLPQVLIILCRNFYTVRMFLHMMTIFFYTFHNRFDCKPGC